MKCSYSQSGEDIIVDRIFRLILKKTSVKYLDIGCNDPVINNNTYLFYTNGCSGYCIDPVKNLCKKIKDKRPNDSVINKAVSDSNDKIILYEMHNKTLSTTDYGIAIGYGHRNYKIKAEYEVESTTLNTLLEDTLINYVSIDTEGTENRILRAWDYKKHRPDVFCIETREFVSGKQNPFVKARMENYGYTLFAFTDVNSIYVNNELL